MYDFRHSGICYWMNRYKHETALRYRSGHKDSKMLDYYSQFLGMKDTITDEDLEDTETRTELQKQINKERKEREILQEKLEAQNNQIAAMLAKMSDIETIKKAIEIRKEGHPLHKSFKGWCLKQNVSPSNKSARKFLKKYPQFVAQGVDI